MFNKKLKKKIIVHYSHHGVHINLKPFKIIGNNEIYRFKLKPGTKEHAIFDCASDIQTALRLPLFQPYREGLNIYLAISEKPDIKNSLWNMLLSQEFRRSNMRLPIALGYDIKCKMFFADLGKMPHALYAGSTNSGKSVGLLCLTLSLIIGQSVKNVNLILFDIGASSLDLLEGVPHLSHPIVKDADTGMYVIKSLVEEMERRIKLEGDELRNLPAIVCVMDEFVSFINAVGKCKQVQEAVSKLLCRGRHAKIHMVFAAQDPTVKNMKIDLNNITARMAFLCAKYQNSITVLNEGGAERLSGNGAMFYKSNEYPQKIYLQGAYVSHDDAKQLIERVKMVEQDLSVKFVIPEFEVSNSFCQVIGDFDSEDGQKKELADIIVWTLPQNTVSAKRIKEKFNMGNRVNDAVERMCKMEIVDKKFAKQARNVIPTAIDDLSEEVICLLEQCGYDIDYIIEIFQNKSKQNEGRVKAGEGKIS